jgi:hypothetical protein
MGMRSQTCLWGALSMRNLALGIGLTGMVGVMALGAPQVRAATTGPSIPFDAVVAASKLVVVATIELRADAAIVVHIERVLVGIPPASSQLVFEAPADPPPLADGGRAVIAFSVPSSIEAGAPTRAWQISADGFVDPDGMAPADGLPPTLAALYTWFGLPLREAGPASEGFGLSNAIGPILLVLLALAMAEGGIAHRDRRRAPGG